MSGRLRTTRALATPVLALAAPVLALAAPVLALAAPVLALATISAPAAASEPAVSTTAEQVTTDASPRASGFRLALRTGFAVPAGEAFGASGPLNDSISGYFPLRVDFGYRFARHFYLGVDAQYALVVPAGCARDASCSGSNVRAGVMAAYHVLPDRFVDPWVGAGIGFERLALSRTVEGATLDMTARGLELANLEIGADFRLSTALRAGPVLSSSAGRYTAIRINGAETSDFDARFHAWILLGIRGAYEL